MFLKSLVVRGFKSFAEKTTLVFEPGITIVVGPNGSGKSNVVDAISWVLGEQGPRSLRGGKMEDVIFAGSPQRPALGMAEVSLTIDNSAKLLPIEFSEVTLSRTLFRSGESEYRLNGAVCRLLDIQEVLSDTGVGREQHTIVGQGRLDEVLNAGPDQLRGFIEEAAGVGKHRRRKERASRKIAATEQNMVRLSDLLSEVRRQLKPLREQAEVAKKQARIAEELSDIRFLIAVRNLSATRSGLGPGGSGALQSMIPERQAELNSVEQRISEVEKERRDLDAKVEAQKEGAWTLGRSVERLSALSRLAGERARSLEALLAVETEMAARIRVDELERQAREFEASLGEAREAERCEADSDRKSRPGERSQTLERAGNELRELRQTLSLGSAEITELVKSTFSELEELNVEATAIVTAPSAEAVARLSRSLAIFQARLPQIESTARKLESDMEKLTRAHEEALQAHLKASKELDESRGSLSMASARRRVLEERLESAKAALQSAREAVSTVAGRRQQLSESMAHALRVSTGAEILQLQVADWAKEAADMYESLRSGLGDLDGTLSALKDKRQELAQSLEEMRDQAQRNDLHRSEIALKAMMLEDKLRTEWGAEPDAAVAQYGHVWDLGDSPEIDFPLRQRLAALPDESLERRKTRIERDLSHIGQVNPLASDQFESLAEREQFLSAQLGDLRSSRRDLQKVVDSVDEQIETLFQAAFAEVADQFQRLFAMLFPGGRGRLILTDPGDLLETGVEVEARPGGKNLKRLSLLSGGERALSALALLFSIFRARPSPFYILDEVEAALDDVNLHRFLGLLGEFREASQLLVVTHQKRTMEVADVLYGVSIGRDGASRVISERFSASSGVAQNPGGLIA